MRPSVTPRSTWQYGGKNESILITPGVRCQSRVTLSFNDTHCLFGLIFFISTRNFVRLSQTYNNVMNNNNNNNNNNKLIRMREEEARVKFFIFIIIIY